MSKRKKALFQLIVLSIIIGLISWHTVYWHISNMHTTIFEYIEAGKGYLTVLYYIGLIIVTGILLGILMGKILEVLGYQEKKAGNTAGGEK